MGYMTTRCCNPTCWKATGRTTWTDLALRHLNVKTISYAEVAGKGPGYMAPEQLLGMEVTPATDLYSVGVMFFELVTGRRPFVARDEFELAQLTMMTPAPHLDQFLPDAPPLVEKMLGALLTKNPRERPQDAGKVRAELMRLSATLAG